MEEKQVFETSNMNDIDKLNLALYFIFFRKILLFHLPARVVMSRMGWGTCKMTRKRCWRGEDKLNFGLLQSLTRLAWSERVDSSINYYWIIRFLLDRDKSASRVLVYGFFYMDEQLGCIYRKTRRSSRPHFKLVPVSTQRCPFHRFPILSPLFVNIYI